MSDEKKKVVKVKAKPVKVAVKVAKPEPEVTKSLFEEPADAVWSREAQEAKPPVKIAKAKPAAPAEPVAAAKPVEAAKPEAAAKKPSDKPEGYVPFYKKWWFWLIVAGLALALIALVLQDRNAGGTTNVTSISVTSVQPTSATAAPVAGSVTVDDANQTVTVTLPADFFAGSKREDIIAEAEAEGFDSCVVNSDGSVTYTMNKEKQASILSDFKREIDNSIKNLTSTGTSYKSIVYNEGVTQFDVRVDKDAFAGSETDQGYAAALFMLGGYYQMFSGVPNDQVDVILNLIDDANGQTIGAVTYQEAMAGM